MSETQIDSTLYPKRGAELKETTKQFFLELFAEGVDEGAKGISLLSEADLGKLQLWEKPYAEELEKIGFGQEIEVKVYPLRNGSKIAEGEKMLRTNTCDPDMLSKCIESGSATAEDLESFIHERVFSFSFSDAQIEQNVYQLYAINGLIKQKVTEYAKALKRSQTGMPDLAREKELYSDISKKITNTLALYQQQTRQYLEDDLLRELTGRIGPDGRLDIEGVVAPRRLSFAMNKEEVAEKIYDMTQFKRKLLAEINNVSLTPVQEEQPEINNVPLTPVQEEQPEINNVPLTPVQEEQPEINNVSLTPVQEEQPEVNNVSLTPVQEEQPEVNNVPLTPVQKELLKLYVKKLNVLIAASAHKGAHTTFSSEHRRQRRAGKLTKFIFGVSESILPSKERSVIPKIVKDKANKQMLEMLEDATSQDDRIRGLGLDPRKVLDDTPGSPYTFTSEQAREIAEQVLREYDLLSEESYTTYAPERTGPASDGKWQVVVSPKASTMSVNGIKKVVFIPANRTYNILQIVSILIGHEIEGHVLQGVNKEHMPLKLFQKGGDRASLWAEMGAMYNQDKVSQECFGIISPAQPDYIPAMIAKENGGNYLEVVKAMFDAHADRIAAMPTEEEKNRAKKSVLKRSINRAFRIYNGTDDFETRGTGVTHSKDTVYLEQDIVMDFLKIIKMEKLAFLGGVNLESVAMLLKTGLLDIDKVVAPKNIAQKFWLQVRPRYLLDTDLPVSIA